MIETRSGMEKGVRVGRCPCSLRNTKTRCLRKGETRGRGIGEIGIEVGIEIGGVIEIEEVVDEMTTIKRKSSWCSVNMI